ncbi:DUF6542 domain-containing protein [Actinoallomurus rhizosphaericola]|uniref:DUF6542 domain-containing protein n=1 Tax=Actinoallomurus rhizosphaericola TaxID=2952536 RepID=UPI0020901CF1|nr:DUF6542 domain-containing protein [Actinoallomurus rhizosphaericola]MCO5992662.1 hypothetical protein [Actinoallomurus rhizosphaericola]
MTLTGRGGTVVVFACTLLGAVAGGLFGIRSAQGVLFVAGCLLAVSATRRTDLLTLVVTPPLLFFLVSLLSAVTGSLGEKSFLVSVAVTVAAKLTSSVPWLFLGAVLVVLIAVPRGLPANLRELRTRVAADNPFRGRASLRDRGRGRKTEDEDPVRWDESPGRPPAAKAPAAESADSAEDRDPD